MILCSLNEVEMYGRRAARGAGMSWGLAEEAGKAARWLAERGLPGVELLARLLTANDGRSYSSMAPVITGNRWQASAGDLCPVCCGAALCDRIDILARDGEIRMGALAYPLLLAPFLDQATPSDHRSYELHWSDVRLSVSVDGVTFERENEAALLSERVDEARVSVGKERKTHAMLHPGIAGIKTPLSAWRAIDKLAQRTYVPATEESRARGAGAGRTDND